MTTHYVVETFENDNGETVLPLPQELVESLGWQEGDTLKWSVTDDGAAIIEKVVQNT